LLVVPRFGRGAPAAVRRGFIAPWRC
jgi:hypothetical protein